MTLIKIEQNDNGSHDNQTIYGVTPEIFPVPDGWAVIPEELGTPETLENYPFGEITTVIKYRYSVEIGGEIKSVELDEREEAGGMDETIIQYVTSWTPLPIPEPGPEPEEGEQYTDSDMILALMGYNRKDGSNENC